MPAWVDDQWDDRWDDARAREAADQSMARGNRDLWARAVAYLAAELPIETKKQIASIAADGKNWIGPYHFGWGMAIRNLLRRQGFGEKEFGIENMDNIYVPLVEEAVRATKFESAQPCGCDPGCKPPHKCADHQQQADAGERIRLAESCRTAARYIVGALLKQDLRRAADLLEELP